VLGSTLVKLGLGDVWVARFGLGVTLAKLGLGDSWLTSLGLSITLGRLGHDSTLARLGLGSSLAKVELVSVRLAARGLGGILFSVSGSDGTDSEGRLGLGRALLARLGFGVAYLTVPKLGGTWLRTEIAAANWLLGVILVFPLGRSSKLVSDFVFVLSGSIVLREICELLNLVGAMVGEL
jgi:hypothetical protein